MLDAATAQQRWQSAASTAQTRYTEGVQATTKDPLALAAAQASKMLAGVQQAVTSGRWQRQLAAAAPTWKQDTIAKANNYLTGINASGQKYQQGYGAFAAYMQPYQNQINSMPKNSLADSIARATAWIQNAANYKTTA